VPERQRQERSPFAAVWLFALVALVLGWLAYSLQSEPAGAHEEASPAVAASEIAAPISATVQAAEPPEDSTRAAAAAHTVSAPEPGLPRPTPQPQTVRTEAPPLAPAVRVSGGDDYEQLMREEYAALHERETAWRTRASRSIDLLRTAVAGYRTQVCAEARGGIAVSTTRDRTGPYISARAEAQALEESARLAGAPAGWVRIPWAEFPEPEDAASQYDPSTVAKRWSCGDVAQ
jgi:hypothetical protein